MTSESQDLRAGEVAVELPPANDAGLIFIGRLYTPWRARADCPRQGSPDGPLCRVELFEPWVAGLAGIEGHDWIQVLYWLHEARRDLVLQSPHDRGDLRGTFSLRSPVRPNPIGSQVVRLERIEEANLFVRGLDCIDGTPLLDLKPDRCPAA